MLIHRPGFPIMAFLTQWLPVVLVPEQCLVSPVRYDMIYNRRRGQLSFLLALNAKWMFRQEPLSRCLPPAGVAAIGGTGSVTNMQFGVKFAITIVR